MARKAAQVVVRIRAISDWTGALFVVAIFQFFAAAAHFVDQFVTYECGHGDQDEQCKHIVITAFGRRLLVVDTIQL